MLSILDAVRDTLPPTRTYQLREFIFIPADSRERGEDGLGRLTLKLQNRTGKRHNYRYDLDSYVLDDGGVEPGDEGGRGYFLLNLTDPEAEEVYRCVIGGMKPPRCNCKAGKCRVPGEPDITEGCKHRDAIQHLIEGGYL